MTLVIPEILNFPPKLFPFATGLCNYSYHLIEGGRGSAKTQSVGRFILYVCEKRRVRVCCGREFQSSIDESVKTVLVDLIKKYKLDFEVWDRKIVHRKTGSTIFFKGFREAGRVSIKGLEGVDILWIDESQSITKATLDIIVPTIRRNGSVIIFTMNRYTRSDPVYKFCAGRPDCLHIKINYDDNPHCPQRLINEAQILKGKNIKEYRHIWGGEPLDQTNDFLIAPSKIEAAQNLILKADTLLKHNRVMSVDLSGCGGDLNVAKLLEQKTRTAWEEEITQSWSEPDTDITRGKIINLYSLWQPDILILDADGMGYPIFVTIKKSVTNCIGFRGAGKAKLNYSGNQRADGYLTLKDFIENGWLKLNCENSSRQLELMKLIHKPGYLLMQNKKEMREELGESPDFADSLMMGIYAINFYAHLFNYSNESIHIESDFDPIN